MKKLLKLVASVEGKVAQPLILWMLGVPGSLCVILWALFWRGK